MTHLRNVAAGAVIVLLLSAGSAIVTNLIAEAVVFFRGPRLEGWVAYAWWWGIVSAGPFLVLGGVALALYVRHLQRLARAGARYRVKHRKWVPPFKLLPTTLVETEANPTPKDPDEDDGWRWEELYRASREAVDKPQDMYSRHRLERAVEALEQEEGWKPAW